jgi:hypothetical protein
MEETRRRTIIVGTVFGIMLVVTVVWSYFAESDARRTRAANDLAEQHTAPPEELARTLGVDAEAFMPAPSDPAPPAGNLKDEAARFVSIDACVEDRARLDPLVGDSLRAIGYDTLLRDSCRVLEALHSQSNAPCAQIEASQLRRHCESTVAMSLAKPDDCPFRGGKAEGRDPTCVAIAARDRRLCAGAGAETARCEAVLAHEPRMCPRAHAEGDACRRDVQRLGSMLTGGAEDKKAFPPPRMAITLQGQNGTPDPSPPSADQSADAATGVVVVKARDRLVVEIGRFGRADLGPAPTRARVALRASAQGPGDGTLERIELDVPLAGTAFFPGNHVEGTTKIDALDAKRGAPVKLTFDGTVSLGTRAYAVQVRVDTFVRDVVTDDELVRFRKDEAMPAPGASANADR